MVSPLAKAFLSSVIALLIAASFLAPMAINYVVRPWPGIEIHVQLISDRGRVFTAENLGLVLYAEIWAIMPPGRSDIVRMLYDGRVLNNLIYLKLSDLRDVVNAWVKYSLSLRTVVNPSLLIVLYVYNPSTGYMLKRSPVITLTYDPFRILSGEKQVFNITLEVPLTSEGLKLKIWEQMICYRRYYWSIDRIYTVDDIEVFYKNTTSTYLGEKYVKTPLMFIETENNISIDTVLTYNGFNEIVFYGYSILVNENRNYFETSISGPCLKGNYRLAITMDTMDGKLSGYMYVLTKPLIIIMSEYYYDSCSLYRALDTGFKQIVYIVYGLALNGDYVIGGVDYNIPSPIKTVRMNKTLITLENTPLHKGYLNYNEYIVINDIIKYTLRNSNKYLLFSPVTPLRVTGVIIDDTMLGVFVLFKHGIEGFIANKCDKPILVYVLKSMPQYIVLRDISRKEIYGDIVLLYIVVTQKQ